MGRRSTKENKSIWQVTREGLDLTREKAGDLIPGFSPERIEKIENGRTQIQPEDVMLLAEYYKAPVLRNYYCSQECPIGKLRQLPTESKELVQIAVETLNAVNKMLDESHAAALGQGAASVVQHSFEDDLLTGHTDR